MLELVKTLATLRLVGDRLLISSTGRNYNNCLFIMGYWALMELLFGFFK